MLVLAAGIASWLLLVKPILQPEGRYIYPRWQREKGAVWTAIGRPGDIYEAIVGPGGEIQPWNYSACVNFWVYDRDARTLYAPEEMSLDKIQWRLMDGHLPVTISTWKAGDVTVEITNASGTRTASRIKLTNTGEDRRLYLYAAIRPHGVSPRYSKIDSLKIHAGAAYVNGHRAIEPLNLQYEAGVSPVASNGIDGDISWYATRGALPEKQELKGIVTGAFRYDVDLKRGKQAAYGFAYAPANAPDSPLLVGDVTADDLILEASEQWKYLFENTIKIEIPDKRMQDSFYASLAYLLVLKDGPYVVPGPLNYNSIWVRDAAYVVDALLKTGLIGEADETTSALLQLRRENGLMPPVFNMGLVPLTRDEWDSQGQIVYMIAQRYRLTGDKAALAAQYPAVGRTCVFIHETRKRNLLPELKGTPYYGIMPPSLSAEDIGSERWHHYWDDFWCIYALKQSAQIAGILGKGADVKWMTKEAEELRTATLASIRLTGGPAWIANGPEDKKSSSSARGATAAIWPTKTLTAAETSPAFDAFWRKWVEPNNGGFMHGGRLWPYATLSLAHAYLWNGNVDKAHSMLKWTLENQTAPGVYAWSEVADPKSGRFAGGDIPHGWGAAEYILLLRDMLLRDDGQSILLLSGVPEDWLRNGKTIKVKGAPAYGGRIGFETVGNLEKDRLAIKLSGSYSPKIPVEVRLPVSKPGSAALPNGKVLPVMNGRFIFPKGVTSAVITLGKLPVQTVKPAAAQTLGTPKPVVRKQMGSTPASRQ